MNRRGAGIAFVFLAALFLVAEVVAQFYLLRNSYYNMDSEGQTTLGPDFMPEFAIFALGALVVGALYLVIAEVQEGRGNL